MDQNEADERFDEAEKLAQRLNIEMMKEDNFLVRYLAICLIKDTMDRAIPKMHQKIIADIVCKTNESMLIQVPKEEMKKQKPQKIIGDDGEMEFTCEHGVGHGNGVHTCDPGLHEGKRCPYVELRRRYYEKKK